MKNVWIIFYEFLLENPRTWCSKSLKQAFEFCRRRIGISWILKCCNLECSTFLARDFRRNLSNPQVRMKNGLGFAQPFFARKLVDYGNSAYVNNDVENLRCLCSKPLSSMSVMSHKQEFNTSSVVVCRWTAHTNIIWSGISKIWNSADKNEAKRKQHFA